MHIVSMQWMMSQLSFEDISGYNFGLEIGPVFAQPDE
jgi:hypothetical protein